MSSADDGYQGRTAEGLSTFRASKASRRALVRAAGAGALAMAGGSWRALAVPPRTVVAGSQAIARFAVFPRHNTFTASPYTEITFRGVSAEELGTVTVVGSISGGHSGLLMPHADGNGLSFVPDARFEPGEVVTVQAETDLGPTGDDPLTFGVVQPAEISPSPASRVIDEPAVPPQTFRSRPDLRPPAMSVNVPADGTDEGYIFLGAIIEDGQAGAMILDDDGEIIWFNPPASDLDDLHDVRVQEYRGEPVITFAEANGPLGFRLGHYVICDSTYQRIAQIQIGNGYTGGDHHEFLLTPRGTALIGAYHPVRWDLSSVGGSKYGNVLDAVVQEIEIETGRVLFEWHSLDDITPAECYLPAPSDPDEPFDYVHYNSIGIAPDGNLVVNSRHTFASYKIDYGTGEILWRLNGKESDFEMGDGTPFSYQHDTRVLDNGEVTLFDNAGTNPEADETTDSRGLVLTLDEEAMTATLAREYIHPTGILATSQGNMQLLPNGNVFIGWGSAPVFSEFTADGELIFNGRFPQGGNSYRAYRMPWRGQPAEPPAVAVERGTADAVTVYASWNGSTEVVSWRVLAGPAPDTLEEVGSGERTGFETEIAVETDAAYVAVEALDDAGTTLSTSEAVETGA